MGVTLGKAKKQGGRTDGEEAQDRGEEEGWRVGGEDGVT